MEKPESFTAWANWFREYQDRQLPIEWDRFERIPDNIHATIASSVAQFQLGESSEARNLKAKVAKFVKRGGDKAYQEAIEWFIFEENRHSRLLGRFMSLENMPKSTSQFTDRVFRLARHNVGLRHALFILLSAELIAVPYYRALQNATNSPILTTICKQILLDEETHIRFQSKAIQMLQGRLSKTRRKADYLVARALLEVALDIVWFNHSDLLLLGGYHFSDLRRESLEQFHHAWAMINGKILNPAPGTKSQDAGESLSNRSLSRKALWSDLTT
jgi:hypothetical protein